MKYVCVAYWTTCLKAKWPWVQQKIQIVCWPIALSNFIFVIDNYCSAISTVQFWMYEDPNSNVNAQCTVEVQNDKYIQCNTTQCSTFGTVQILMQKQIQFVCSPECSVIWHSKMPTVQLYTTMRELELSAVEYSTAQFRLLSHSMLSIVYCKMRWSKMPYTTVQ